MNNTYICSIIFILISSLSVMANDGKEDSLLRLDSMIHEKRIYMDIKESRIDSLKKLSAQSTDMESLYLLNNQIIEEYSTYRYDSAMHYITKNKAIVDKLNIQHYRDEITLQTSTLLATSGMIKESIDMLNSITRTEMDTSLLLKYYMTSEWVYYTARNYANDEIYAPHYKQLEMAYLDSVYEASPIGSVINEYHRGYIMLRQGETEGAKIILTNLLNSLPVNDRQYAITASNLSTISRIEQDYDMYEEYLIKAATSDIMCALKENVALQNLAFYLYKNKPQDLERAYNYIQSAMEDAQFYNSRFRTVQISKNLPIIVSAYHQRSESENETLKTFLIVISILTALMLLLLFSIYRQITLLRRSRKKQYNLNIQLRELNAKLSETNKTKEEYVGLFMDLCSSYIDKLGQYMDIVKRKIIAKQTDDLYKLSNSPSTIKNELDSFLNAFDKAFLNLYPTFIQDFNNLLVEDKRIVPKEGEQMNTELRIFALIRLGISDSSKIAAFLHYSPQTIYNYRAKVKNFSIVDREEFEKRITEIGAFAEKKY